MLSLVSHQFLCASRNLTDKCYLQCQAVGCKNPAEGPPRIFVDRECFAPFKTEFSWKKMPGGPLALQRQLRKFYILVIIFAILVKFRAKFCNILNFEILSFSDVSAMIFHHFWLIWIKFQLLGLIKYQFWKFHFQAAFHNFQTSSQFSLQK